MIAGRGHLLDRLPGRRAGWTTLRVSSLRRLWPLLLPIPAILLPTWAIVVWKFNGLYGQDPFAYFDYGVGPLRHSLLHGSPPPAMFWPLGYPILIALTSFVLGPVTAAGQIVNLIAGAAAVFLTYLLGRDVLLQAGAGLRLSRNAGALGALLLGAAGRLTESSVLIMADSVALATALLSAWALVHWSIGEEKDRSHAAWLALSAAALAWSVVTRWGQAVLVVAWLVAVLPTALVRRQHLWRAAAWAILSAVVVLGTQFWLVVTVPPEANLGSLPFAGDLALVNGAGSGWSLIHLLQNSFVNADGVERYHWPNALFYVTGPFLPQYLTPLFLPAALLGLAVAARRFRRALLLLLSWPAVLLLFDSGLAEQNPRFVLAALPPVAILAGLGLADLWERLLPRLQLFAATAIATGLLVVAIIGMCNLATVNAYRNGDLQVAAWTAARVPAGATILSFGITLTLQHVTRLHVIDLSVLSKSSLKRLSVYRHPLYTLVQVGAMNGQFAARPPGINYRSLRADPGLVRLGAFHSYTLSRVGST